MIKTLLDERRLRLSPHHKGDGHRETTRRGAWMTSDAARVLAVALLLVEGGIHLQQYEGPLNAVPTINTLFVINAIGAAAIALVLAGCRGIVALLGALAGLGMTLGALVSLAITRRCAVRLLRAGAAHGAVACRTRRAPLCLRLSRSCSCAHQRTTGVRVDWTQRA
jgi:hypothetical protein